MGIRVLVCGGRDYGDAKTVYKTLDGVHAGLVIDVVIHGAAKGADLLAMDWAAARGIPDEAYPANWDRYGKAAGPIRNERMLVEGKPDLVIAFPGGKGTADMVRQADEARVMVMRA